MLHALLMVFRILTIDVVLVVQTLTSDGRQNVMVFHQTVDERLWQSAKGR